MRFRSVKWKTLQLEYQEQISLSLMTRDEALRILFEFTKSESLRRHALQVEVCVAAYAQHFGEDEEKWRVTALLHDFDYEIHPSAPEHPRDGEPILIERGVSAEIRRAILSHANYSGVSRDSLLEKSLFACDELSGFISACALVKPTRKVADVEVSSVRKKMKDKAFARSVSREDIVDGAVGLEIDLDQARREVRHPQRANRARAARPHGRLQEPARPANPRLAFRERRRSRRGGLQIQDVQEPGRVRARARLARADRRQWHDRRRRLERDDATRQIL